MTNTLEVHLYGTHIGDLTPIDGASPGSLGVSFLATPEGIAKFRANSTVLSIGLPLSDRPLDATAFVGGLLPEGETLQNLQSQLGATDVFSLISFVGRDVAGAVSFISPENQPDFDATPPTYTPPAYTPVDDREIAQLLDTAATQLAGGSSLPGYQRKITLALIDQQWHATSGGAPSTHILKPVAADRESSVQAENYALSLGRAAGLLRNDSYVEHFNSRPALVIERYDRRVAPADRRQAERVGAPISVSRIHQEDAAQALRLSWSSAYAKFSPTMANIAALLPEPSLSDIRAGRNAREQLLRYMTFNVAIGNTDAHAKNFSLLHLEDGRVELAPMYDVAPIAMAYDGNKILALAIDDIKLSTEITKTNLSREAQSWGISRARADHVIEDTLLRLERAVLTSNPHEMIEAKIPNFILGQTYNLLEGKPAAMRASVPLDLAASIPRPPRPSGIAAALEAPPKDAGHPSAKPPGSNKLSPEQLEARIKRFPSLRGIIDESETETAAETDGPEFGD